MYVSKLQAFLLTVCNAGILLQQCTLSLQTAWLDVWFFSPVTMGLNASLQCWDVARDCFGSRFVHLLSSIELKNSFVLRQQRRCLRFSNVEHDTLNILHHLPLICSPLVKGDLLLDFGFEAVSGLFIIESQTCWKQSCFHTSILYLMLRLNAPSGGQVWGAARPG